MPSHLIPEQRPDRNGKIVTRHVRPQTGPAGGRAIPAPASHVESLLAQFSATLPSWGRNERRIPALRLIAQSKPQLFADMMRSYLDGSNEERAVWRCTLQDEETEDEINEMHYRRIIELVSLSVALYPDSPPGYRESMILRHASYTEAELATWPGDDTYSQVKARIIIAVVERLTSTTRDGRDEDAAFIAQNMDEVMPLVPELLKRRTASTDVIEVLLEGEAQALHEGAL